MGYSTLFGDTNAQSLDDLADLTGVKVTLLVRVCASLLAALWLVPLITVSGLKRDTWFLMIIGSIGMIHHVLVGDTRRCPEAFCLHIDFARPLHTLK